MPTTSRPRALLAAAGVLLLPLLGLAAPGTASAASPVASESPTPSPTPCDPIKDPGCLAPKPSVTPTASPTPSPTPTRSATPSPSPRRTSSPAPRRTRTPSTGSTENPVTGTVDLGGVASETPTPTTSPETKDTSSTRGSGDHLTRLLFLVLGGGVLLGLSGATGLYLTRHHE